MIESQSNNADKGDLFLRSMCNHLVALTGLYESYQDGKLLKRGMFAISGFILRMQDRHCWVTAGHCLKDALDDPIRRGDLKIIQCGFADYFGVNAKYVHPVPYSYEPDCGFYIDDREQGLDFGVIQLDHLTVQNLAANGIRDVGRENWEHVEHLSFAEYKMLGLPSHRSIESASSNDYYIGAVQPTMISITKIDGSTIKDPPPREWFVGQIPEVDPVF